MKIVRFIDYRTDGHVVITLTWWGLLLATTKGVPMAIAETGRWYLWPFYWICILIYGIRRGRKVSVPMLPPEKEKDDPLSLHRPGL